ncbi:hypothetical protein N7462_009808 [Penicillium macrosclerotiorum]|uniref:uncharacterized protein n=1 Tax=Penicillium macrosclerotiorum TaxID=303699 RepID=UPI002548F23B|nr:uncharacterized protein N7462_009808 [Penicillium macrosclerotiorum]KAJ5668738.1 hypothetical protein N7462_009808 [Penicillium macrosclerotiorum]
MTTTVNNLMRMFSSIPLYTEAPATLPRHKWIEKFHPIEAEHVTVWPATNRTIEKFLGPGSTPSAADTVGLGTAAYMLNTRQQKICTEGDVMRDFDQNVLPPVDLAFSGSSALSRPASGAEPIPAAPRLWSRSLMAARGSTSAAKIVDYQMTMSHPERSLESAAMIGQMKYPRTISRREWEFKQSPSELSIHLGRELRAYGLISLISLLPDLFSNLRLYTQLTKLKKNRYACEYQCPQVFAFDVKTLLIVQFRATSPAAISRRDCPVDCCVVSREMNAFDTDQCTMQYALYRLAWRGWLRLSATLEFTEEDRLTESTVTSVLAVPAPKPLVMDGFTRQYEYWSGCPIWVDHRGYPSRRHPSGHRRHFIYRQHVHRDGTTEIQGVWTWGRGVDDTGNCFISG